jgi:uncharacterized protein (DUF433 family)
LKRFLSCCLGDKFSVNLCMAQIDYKQYIEVDPEIRFGRPVIKGTRISVYDVLQWLASVMSHKDILNDFPQLKDEQILACLSYAANKERVIKVA